MHPDNSNSASIKTAERFLDTILIAFASFSGARCE
jgi:hypothetical protein